MPLQIFDLMPLAPYGGIRGKALQSSALYAPDPYLHPFAPHAPLAPHRGARDAPYGGNGVHGGTGIRGVQSGAL